MVIIISQPRVHNIGAEETGSERQAETAVEEVGESERFAKETTGETYGDDLLGNELGNLEDIAISRNTKQESNRVKDVGQDGL